MEHSNCCESTLNFNFSMALNLIKEGFCVRRRGWNGKGMHVAMAELFATDTLGSENIKIDNKCLLLYNAQGKFNTWIPSITDLFADDWETIKVEI